MFRIKSEGQDFGWGIFVNFTKQRINPKMIQLGKEKKNKDLIDMLEKNESFFIMDMYLFVKNKLTIDNVLQPGDIRDRSDGKLGIVPVVLHPSNIH